MTQREIDHLPTQAEIDSYKEDDIVLVYDKNKPELNSANSRKVMYPVTHQFVVGIDETIKTKKVLYPIKETYVVGEVFVDQES